MKFIRKPKIYLETTLWNFMFTDDAPEKQEITQRFFQQLDLYEIFISDLVLAELQQTLEPKRSDMIDLINSKKPAILEISEEVEQLAQKYIEAEILTDKHKNDILHIAVAVVNDLNMLISWNMKHIVRVKPRQGINAVNRLFGYKEIEIVNPQEIVEYE